MPVNSAYKESHSYIEKLHYEFWFEPHNSLGVQFKMKVYTEYYHESSGSANYLHRYFSNPFVTIQSVNGERISGGKKYPIVSFVKYEQDSPGILYSDAEYFGLKIPDVISGDRTSSTMVYTFRDSRSIIPVFFAGSHFVKNCKITFKYSPNIYVSPFFFQTDSTEFTINRRTEKRENIIEIVRQNIPALEREENDDRNSSYNLPFIYFFIKGGKINNTPVYSLSSFSDLYNYDYGFLKMMANADSTKLKTIVDTLTSTTATEKENMEKIFNWVKDNIKYTAIMEGKTNVVPESATSVLNSKYGDCKGMTSLLNGLARTAKIPLYYGWLGTRSIYFQPSEIPIPYAFNHMVAVYINNGDTLVLDATYKNAQIGQVSPLLYGKEIVISLGENKFAVYKVPTPLPNENKLKVNVQYTTIDNNWTANYSAHVEGQKKMVFDYLNKLPTDYYNKKRNPIFPEMSTDQMMVSELKNLSNEQSTMSWKQPLTDVIKTSSSLLINPFPDKYKALIKIDTDKRVMPIEMDFPFRDEITISLQIPEGYELNSQLQELSYSDELGEIKCHSKLEGNTVVAEFSLELKSMLINPSEFTQFNNLKNTLKKCISAYIVFKKQE